MRLALLSQHQYCALVNSFSNSEDIAKKLEGYGAIDIGKLCTKSFNNADDTRVIVSDVEENPSSEKDDTAIDWENSQANSRTMPLDDNAELNYFVPASKVVGEDTEVVNESEYYDFYKPETETNVVPSTEEFKFPPHLKVFAFERGDIQFFPSPSMDELHLHGLCYLQFSSVLC